MILFELTSVRLGAEYAAGIATALADSKYGELVEFVDYLSPHQPGGFASPSKIKGRQFSTATDRVTSDAGPLGEFLNLFNGGSDLEQIPRTSEYHKGKVSRRNGRPHG